MRLNGCIFHQTISRTVIMYWLQNKNNLNILSLQQISWSRTVFILGKQERANTKTGQFKLKEANLKHETVFSIFIAHP